MTWTLIPAGLLYGIIAALVFHRCTDREAIHGTTNRMIAHVLEFRLFLDSPRLIFRAQRDLVRENLHLLRLIALPCLAMAALFTLIFPALDAMYGHAPLRPGERSVVTVQLDPGPPASPALEPPNGIRVETPGMYILHDRQISWRIRPLGNVSANMTLLYNGRTLTRRIAAGAGLVYGWQFPFTRPAIDIRYPSKTILGANWLVWFFLLSATAAVALT